MENTEPKKSIFKKPWVQSISGIIVIILLVSGILIWKSVSSHVSIDTSIISAPIIGVGSEVPGILTDVYVKPGDMVTKDEPLARVGSEILSAKIGGIIIDVENTPGQVFAAGVPVVSMIDPGELRVVGTIDENKGLSRIKVGDPALFTVDAFSGKTFTGIVDEISQTSNESGAVFSISDKRQIKQFQVKVRYDTALYPEFKNGMSAKLKIYTK
jgi:multidrug resistance efflux pump